MDFGEELAELGAVLFAGSGFDAAGYVYGVGADVEDGLGDVLGGEAAGEDDAVIFRGAAGDGPVGASAGAAVFAGFGGVEEEGADDRSEGPKLREAEIFADAQGFGDVEKFCGGASFPRGFIAVELDGVETDGAG